MSQFLIAEKQTGAAYTNDKVHSITHFVKCNQHMQGTRCVYYICDLRRPLLLRLLVQNGTLNAFAETLQMSARMMVGFRSRIPVSLSLWIGVKLAAIVKPTLNIGENIHTNTHIAREEWKWNIFGPLVLFHCALFWICVWYSAESFMRSVRHEKKLRKKWLIVISEYIGEKQIASHTEKKRKTINQSKSK